MKILFKQFEKCQHWVTEGKRMRRTSFLIMFERSTNEQNKTRHYKYLQCLGIGMFHIPSCFRLNENKDWHKLVTTHTCDIVTRKFLLSYSMNSIFMLATIFMAGRRTHRVYKWMKTISSSRWFRKNARHRLVDGVNG